MSSNPQSTGISAQSCCWDLNCVSVHEDTEHAKSSDVRPASVFFHLLQRFPPRQETSTDVCNY